MSVVRKGTGIGYSIAGTAVSSIAVLLGIVFIVMIQGMAHGLNEVAQQMERDLTTPPQQQASPVDDIPTPTAEPTDVVSQQTSPPSDVPTPNAEPTDVRSTEPPKDNTPPTHEFHDPSKQLQLGNIQLSISSARIGKVPLHRTIM